MFVFQALWKNVLAWKLAGTVSRAEVAANWPIMSVPIWLTSGVWWPAIAVVSFATAWPQSTGVTLTVTPGLSFMNVAARSLSLTPSLPIAHTVSVPPTEAAGLTAGAWLPAAWLADAPGAVLPDAPGAELPAFVPQAATRRPTPARMAANRKGLDRARLLPREDERSCGMSVLLQVARSSPAWRTRLSRSGGMCQSVV